MGYLIQIWKQLVFCGIHEGSCKYSLQATILFSQITAKEQGKLTWSEFLDFLIQNSATTNNWAVQLSLTTIFSPPHVKRETIAKIVILETDKHFCYVLISKYGRVGLYDGNMNFLTSYHIIMSREDIARKEEERRRTNRWITDAIFLVDVQMFVVTNSARSIAIYDASGLKHVLLWLVLGVPTTIQCFSYHSNLEDKFLFMGDDRGHVLSLKFLQSKQGLLRKKQSDKLNLFYWIELQNEKDYVTITNHGRFHNDIVRQIHFFPDNNTIASCSRDANSSIVVKHVEHRRKPYVYKMNRGCNCFFLSRTLKILLTGSEDGIVRLWNVVTTTKPIFALNGHENGIVDVQIMEDKELFLSCSSDGVLKLWSVKEQICIQTVHIKFPPFKILGKTVEWGINSIYPGPKRFVRNQESIWERSHIFVVCCNYMAKIELKLEENSDCSVLPPPPLQNSVLIPTNWKICNDDTNIISSTSFESTIDEESISKHIESLNLILNKDLFKERNNINYQIATLERKKLQMHYLVSQCAPYLALDLHEIEEIKLPLDLPLPKSKRIKNSIDKTQRMLADATAKSQTLSEPSSSGSRTRSSRSSIISFE